ncbi:hypothetical protein Adt_38863 [Abeliophyllum distichum]|uniref:Uncharacterized protein n=1 Tax=Abeliophyllum distichum TaxID=126358 RepID=A0ABD1Q3F7_9LAMI
MAGSLYLWFSHSFGLEILLHVFQTVYLLKKMPKKKDKDEEIGWYYFGPWEAHKALLSSDQLDVLRSIYQVAPVNRQYESLLNKHRCVIELGLMASRDSNP